MFLARVYFNLIKDINIKTKADLVFKTTAEGDQPSCLFLCVVSNTSTCTMYMYKTENSCDDQTANIFK